MSEKQSSKQLSNAFHAQSPKPGIEFLYWQETLLAILLSGEFHAEGIEFFTPGSFSQQLGYMNRPGGYCIQPHDHNAVTRHVEWTQETLFIRSGRVRVDFYSPGSRSYLASRELRAGDVALLAHGGHGFEMLEPGEIIEVKQGPYAGVEDKTRFEPSDGPLAGEQTHG